MLDYQGLAKAVKNGSLAPVYLFSGQGKYLLQQALKMVRDRVSVQNSAWDCSEVDADGIDETSLFSELNTVPMLAECRLLVVRGAEKYFGGGKSRGISAEEEQMLTKYLENPNPRCCAIFVVEGKADARLSLFKRVKEKGRVIEFNPVRGSDLGRWVRGRLGELGKRMDRRALEYFLACFGEDLALVDQELAKIALYAGSKTDITLGMVREVIGKSTRVGIFEMVDAVGERRSGKAARLVEEMLESGESPVYLTFMIVRQFRLILLVRSLLDEGYSEKQAASKLHLHPFVFRKVVEQSRNFTQDSLKKGLECLLRADVLLKNSSRDPGLLLQETVLKLNCV